MSCRSTQDSKDICPPPMNPDSLRAKLTSLITTHHVRCLNQQLEAETDPQNAQFELKQAVSDFMFTLCDENCKEQVFPPDR